MLNYGLSLSTNSYRTCWCELYLYHRSDPKVFLLEGSHSHLRANLNLWILAPVYRRIYANRCWKIIKCVWRSVVEDWLTSCFQHNQQAVCLGNRSVVIVSQILDSKGILCIILALFLQKKKKKKNAYMLEW